MDIGQTEVAAGKAVRQAFVVESQQVQNRGVHVVHVANIFNRLHAEVICRAVNRSTFDSATSHPDGESFRVMIAAVSTR